MTESTSTDGPIVVVGAHVPGLLLEVEAVPREGETVLGGVMTEPEDGGKATNQAVAAAKLQAPVRLVTLVGNDDRGRRWRTVFERYGIDTGHVIVGEGPTDVGIVMLPPSRIPAIVSPLATSAALDAVAVEGQRKAFIGASYVICQLEAPVECALAAFRLARRAGAKTILNPAPVQPLPDDLLDLTDVLVANEHEAAALVGVDASLADLTQRLARLRPGWSAIVTAGAAGCLFVSAGGEVQQLAAARVEVVDTTGAGDQFVAALAVRLRAGDDLASAVNFAGHAASLSVTRPGTMPSFVTADEPALLGEAVVG